MGPTEQAWANSLSRRRAIAALGGLLAATPGEVQGQIDPRHFRDHRRAPGLPEMRDAYDFEEIAFANLPRQVYDYTAQGANGEWTSRRNRHAFEWVELIERSGVTPDMVDASTEILGVRMDYPIIVAPTATMNPLHPTGEVGMYQGATAAGALMAVSHNSSTAQPDIAAGATGPRWIQIYPAQNLDATQQRLDIYHDAGARAIVITVDQQADRYDRRLHSRWLGGTAPATAGGGGGGGNQARPQTSLTGPARYRVPVPNRMWYTWDFMEQVRDRCRVPVLMKGLLNADDARIAVERGFDGIIVSNHGGRSLDYSPSTLEVLPEIAEVVAGRIPVLIDSGFRRGSDAFKALALGANAVCFGRAPRWGLAAFGPAGVQRILEIFQTELREAMALTGRRNLAAIDRTAVRTDFI